MARIAGVNIPNHQHSEIGLTAIYGIGRTRARKICETAGVPVEKKVKDLSDAELEKLRDEVNKFIVEGDLRREVVGDDLAGALFLFVPGRGRQSNAQGASIDLEANIDGIGVAGGDGYHVRLPATVQIFAGPMIGCVEVLVHGTSLSRTVRESKSRNARKDKRTIRIFFLALFFMT